MDVQAEIRRDHIGQLGETRLERLHLSRRCSLLRAIDAGGPTGSEERIVHVTDGLTAHGGQARLQPARIDAPDLTRGPADRRNVVAGRIEEAHAERGGHADPPVIGGAAADAHNHMTGAQLQGGADKLPGTEGGGQGRVTVLRGEQGQAAGHRHLHDGESPGGDMAQGRPHRLSQRTAHRGDPRLPLQGDNEQLGQPIATVGHRRPPGPCERPPQEMRSESLAPWPRRPAWQSGCP